MTRGPACTAAASNKIVLGICPADSNGRSIATDRVDDGSVSNEHSMRITSTMSYLNLLQGVNRAQERTQTAQNEVSSGKKVLNSPDDPTAAGDIAHLRSEGAEADQYARNVTFAQSKLQVTDGVLDNVQQMVERAGTLGQSSLGGDLTTASAKNGLRDQILSVANTMYLDRFILGGSRHHDSALCQESRFHCRLQRKQHRRVFAGDQNCDPTDTGCRQ